MSTLNDRLLAAHAADDKAQLVDLYQEAADMAGSEDQRGFFLTHAYVFALELHHPDAPDLRARLAEMCRI